MLVENAEITSTVCAWLFFVLPPGVFLACAFGLLKGPTRGNLFFVIALGYLLLNAGLYYRFENLRQLNDASGWKDQQLITEWSSDLSLRLAPFLGWLLPLLYSLPWLIISMITRRREEIEEELNNPHDH